MIATALALMIAAQSTQKETMDLEKSLSESVSALAGVSGAQQRLPSPTECSRVMTYLGKAEAVAHPTRQLLVSMNQAAGLLNRDCRTQVGGRYSAGIDELMAKTPPVPR